MYNNMPREYNQLVLESEFKFWHCSRVPLNDPSLHSVLLGKLCSLLGTTLLCRGNWNLTYDSLILV